MPGSPNGRSVPLIPPDAALLMPSTAMIDDVPMIMPSIVKKRPGPVAPDRLECFEGVGPQAAHAAPPAVSAAGAGEGDGAGLTSTFSTIAGVAVDDDALAGPRPRVTIVCVSFVAPTPTMVLTVRLSLGRTTEDVGFVVVVPDRVAGDRQHVRDIGGHDVDVDVHAVAQVRQRAVEPNRRDDLARRVRRVVALLRDLADRRDVPG